MKLRVCFCPKCDRANVRCKLQNGYPVFAICEGCMLISEKADAYISKEDKNE